MKIKNLFSILATMALVALVGCDKDPQVSPQEPTKPTFKLSETKVNVGAEGDMVTVEYTITDHENGAVVLSNCSAGWIENLSTATFGSIKFTVAPNYSSEERKAEIYVEYSAIKGSVYTIEVTQAASTVPMFSFSNIRPDMTSIVLNITPADTNTAYICRHHTQEYIDSFFLVYDEALVANDMEALAYEAKLANQSLINYLHNIAYTGPATDITFSQLTPDTEYVVYCYHVDLSTGTAVSEVKREVIRTLKPADINISLTTNYEIDGANVAQTITPSDETVPYFVDKMKVTDFYSYYGADADMAETFIAKWNTNVSIRLRNGYYPSQIIEEFCHKGTQTLNYNDLEASTEYVFYAFAINPETAYIASDIVLDMVTTEQPKDTGMTIEIEVTNILANSAFITWTASEPTGRFARSFCTKAEYNSYGSNDEERFAYFKAEDKWFYEAEGFTDMSPTSLTPNTEYVAFAYGLDGETPNTRIFTKEFKTRSNTPGTSNISMSWTSFYNISEVAAIDAEHWGEYASKENYALLPVTISGVKEGDEVYYMLTTWPLDYNNDAGWVTEIMKDKYLMNHYSHCNLVLEYEREYSLIAVAFDANGNLGTLYKRSIYLYKSDASDVAGYTYVEDK